MWRALVFLITGLALGALWRDQAPEGISCLDYIEDSSKIMIDFAVEVHLEEGAAVYDPIRMQIDPGSSFDHISFEVLKLNGRKHFKKSWLGTSTTIGPQGSVRSVFALVPTRGLSVGKFRADVTKLCFSAPATAPMDNNLPAHPSEPYLSWEEMSLVLHSSQQSLQSKIDSGNTNAVVGLDLRVSTFVGVAAAPRTQVSAVSVKPSMKNIAMPAPGPIIGLDLGWRPSSNGFSFYDESFTPPPPQVLTGSVTAKSSKEDFAMPGPVIGLDLGCRPSPKDFALYKTRAPLRCSGPELCVVSHQVQQRERERERERKKERKKERERQTEVVCEHYLIFAHTTKRTGRTTFALLYKAIAGNQSSVSIYFVTLTLTLTLTLTFTRSGK